MVESAQRGLPPNRGNITPLGLFCYTVFFSVTRPGRTVALILTMNDVTWGKYSPKTSQKGAWIGSFKLKRQNLYIAISPELLIRRASDLRSEFRPRKALRGWYAITPKQIQHSYISAANGGISTKFGFLIDFDLLKAVTSTNTKPEVVFSGRGRHVEKWKTTSYFCSGCSDLDEIR